MNEPRIAVPAPDTIPKPQQKLSKDRIVQDACEVYGITTPEGREYLRVALDACVLMNAKNSDYGTGNIAKWGIFGVVVRMSDKFERINNLFKNRRAAKVNESIRDNIKDIHVYAGIALLIDEGKWPGVAVQPPTKKTL